MINNYLNQSLDSQQMQEAISSWMSHSWIPLSVIPWIVSETEKVLKWKNELKIWKEYKVEQFPDLNESLKNLIGYFENEIKKLDEEFEEIKRVLDGLEANNEKYSRYSNTDLSIFQIETERQKKATERGKNEYEYLLNKWKFRVIKEEDQVSINPDNVIIQTINLRIESWIREYSLPKSWFK